MESTRIYIAVKSPLIRLGLKNILYQIGFPVIMKEISDAKKLLLLFQKKTPGLFLLGGEMIPADYIPIKTTEIQIILVQESPVYLTVIPAFFNDSFDREDNERSIYLKVEKSLKFLLKNRKQTIHERISIREKEILKWVALGKTNKEIAEMLFISTHTVVTHRKNLTHKLGIKTIAGLTVYALLHGIILAEEIK